jgi:2-succinyl-5-enolpyruvyl-6-hydroxy-3-cyclohexene-1-carboxylate synthase
VLADPRSGCRLEGTIAAADAILRTEPPLAETLLLLGAPWLSKSLAQYVASVRANGGRVIVADPWWQWTDPNHVVSEFHHVDPDAVISAALAQARTGGSCDPAWNATWQALEKAAQAAIDDTLGREVSEPMVARMLTRHAAAADGTILASASMPMRDLEWYAPALPAPPPVMANRGANGIDGVVSTALGIAATGRRTFALLGDLALLHDVSALVNLPDHLDCTLVVVDNGGGGIFSFLPQAEAIAPEQFELLFGTPPSSDVGAVARGFGLDVHEVGSVAEFDVALAAAAATAPTMIRVRVPGRTENVARHDAINRAVRLALG